MHILVVEDEKKVASFIKRGLEAANYSVDVEHDGEVGLNRLLKGDYDLVILDVMLPGLDGLSLMKEIHQRKVDVPVLLLTARVTVADRVMGLDLAAVTLPAFVASTPVGKTVPVEVMRDGKMSTINVAVGKLNDPTAAVDTKQEKSQWGLAMQNIRPEERRQMGLSGNDGVLVTSVMPASPAANAGVQPGDVILQVNRAPVSSVQGVKDEVAKAKEDKPLLLLLRRADGSTMFAALSPNVG
jgi:CheY-like chemotaxis protein